MWLIVLLMIQLMIGLRNNDESEDTWASWDDLKDVEALHIYLREHDQSHAIPKSHQKLMDKKPAIPKKTSTESTSPLVIEKSPPKRDPLNGNVKGIRKRFLYKRFSQFLFMFFQEFSEYAR